MKTYYIAFLLIFLCSSTNHPQTRLSSIPEKAPEVLPDTTAYTLPIHSDLQQKALKMEQLKNDAKSVYQVSVELRKVVVEEKKQVFVNETLERLDSITKNTIADRPR